MSALPAVPQTSAQFDLSRNVIAGGGGSSSNGNFRVDGTVGQAAVGTQMSNGQFSQTGGFWQPESEVPPSPTPTPNCSYSIAPTSQSFNAIGGANSVNVATTAGCAWTATSNAPSFITINSGASGTGNGTVNYTVSANTGPQRTGTMTIAGQTLTVMQDAAAPTPSPTPTPTPTPTPQAPTLLTEEGTNRAVAIDSVTFVRGPFPIIGPHNFSADQHTRVILFTSNLGLSQPDPSVLTVQALGSTLTVENVGTMSGVPGLDASYIVVRLPDGLPAGDLPLTVTLRGAASNTATLGISP